eukprot:437837-Pleurochrysis_carterae.AAC.1
MKTGTQPHVDKFRTLFCSATCCLHGDAQELSKLAPRVAEGVHLGIDQSWRLFRLPVRHQPAHYSPL